MKLRHLILCIAVLLAAALPVRAATFVYDLNGTLAEANGGPSLVAHGGTLGATGYTFGVQQGLSLSNVIGAADAYSIDIRFYFDDVNASFNGYQRIIEFKDRAADTGLYSLNGTLQFFNVTSCCTNAFTTGQFTNLRLTRSANGTVSAYVNDTLGFSFADPSGLATFTGPNNIIWFFVDDFQTLINFPPESGTGFVDSIRIETVSPVPLSPSIVAQLTGLALLGVLAWRRRRRLPASGGGESNAKGV